MLSEYIRRADSVISVVDTDYIVGNSLNEVFNQVYRITLWAYSIVHEYMRKHGEIYRLILIS